MLTCCTQLNIVLIALTDAFSGGMPSTCRSIAVLNRVSETGHLQFNHACCTCCRNA